MILSLRGLWNGEALPAGLGGEAHFSADDEALRLQWDVALPSAPRSPPREPGFTDGLWEHDVVELFLTSSNPQDGEPSYVEIEAGPAGHWLALAFRGVRKRDAELRELSPKLRCDVDGTRWQGEIEVPLAPLAPWLSDGPLRGLACYATQRHGAALHACSQPLPGERADFHRPSAWSRLTAGRATARAR